MKRKNRKYIPPEHFIVVDEYGAVFAGLQGGYPVYSFDYSEAKTLRIGNTSMLLMDKRKTLFRAEDL
jgi:hypothetical protein